MQLFRDMYVRTHNGEIHKVVSPVIDNNNPKMNRFMDEDGNMTFFTEIKGKPSYRKYDILEDGDYIDGYKVVIADNGIKHLETEKGLVFIGFVELIECKTITTKEGYVYEC